MTNEEIIKRLLTFDDEGDTSTGFVSAIGNQESDMINEETSDMLKSFVHYFGCSYDWLQVTETENWRRDVDGVSIEYTNRGNLYIIIDNDKVCADVEIKMSKLEATLKIAAQKYDAEPLRNIILDLSDSKQLGKFDLHFTDGFMYDPIKGESFFRNNFYFKGRPHNLPRQVMVSNAYFYILSDDRKMYVIPNGNMNKNMPVRWWTKNLNEGLMSQKFISFDEDNTSTGYANVSGNGKLFTVDGVLRELPKFFKERGINVFISTPKVEAAGTMYEFRYVNIKFLMGPYKVKWQTTLGIKDFDTICDNLEYYATQNPDTLRWESKRFVTMQPDDMERVQEVLKEFLNKAL